MHQRAELETDRVEAGGSHADVLLDEVPVGGLHDVSGDVRRHQRKAEQDHPLDHRPVHPQFGLAQGGEGKQRGDGQVADHRPEQHAVHAHLLDHDEQDDDRQAEQRLAHLNQHERARFLLNPQIGQIDRLDETESQPDQRHGEVMPEIGRVENQLRQDV